MAALAEALVIKKGFLKIADAVFQDFTLLAYYFMVESENNRLLRLLYDAYKIGGWAGNFPDGNMILYWPYDKDPELKE